MKVGDHGFNWDLPWAVWVWELALHYFPGFPPPHVI